MIHFGIIGFILIILAFIVPPVLEKKWNFYYFVMIFIVIFLSFINEDAIENQVGLTFTTFFYSIFLWGINNTFENGKAVGA